MPAVALQQPESPDLANHLVRVAVGERRDPEGHVAQDLDVDAPQAEGHQGTEHRVVLDADHHLGGAGEHGLDEDALHRVGAPLLLKLLLDPAERFPDRLGAVEVQDHAAHVGLVDDLERGELHGHRVPHPFGQLYRFLGGGGQPSRRRTESRRPQDGPGLLGVQPAPAAGFQRGAADLASPLQVLVVELGEGPGVGGPPLRVVDDLPEHAADLLGEREDRHALGAVADLVPTPVAAREATGSLAARLLQRVRLGLFSHDRGVHGLVRPTPSARSPHPLQHRATVCRRLVGLHGRVDDDQRVHLVGSQDGLGRTAVGGRIGGSDHVHRVPGAGGRRQELAQLGLELLRERVDPQTGGLERVGAQDRRAARVRDHGGPAARGEGLVDQRPGDAEHLLQRVGPDDPRLTEQRVHRGLRRRERRGVRAGRPTARLGAPRLHDHDRLPAADPAGQPGEAARIAERLQVEEHDPGERVLLPVLEEVVP